ncbi:MAG: hypothetical protein A2Y56_15850 [Candidatus Aminicenantes bacterium RBG_13_63_10]|nr:MAG: hypothetical protein A2Y56_15850 [Candidatus Aminicenantes bacterium RBG_13_63_10]
MEEARLNGRYFVQDALRTYVVHLAATVLGVAMTVLTARALGPGGKGILTLLILIPVLAVTFGRWGIGHALIYYAPREQSRGLMFNGFVLNVIMGLAASALTFAFVSWQKDSLFHDVPPRLLAWMSVMVLFFFIYDFMGYLFVARGQISRRNALYLLFPVAYLVFFAIGVLAMKKGVTGAVAAWSLSIFLAVAIALRMTARSVRRQDLSLNAAQMKRILGYGSRSHPGTMLELLNYRADYLLVNLFAGPAAVGLYSIAANMAEVMWKLPEAVSVVLLPSVARLPPEEARALTARTCRLVLVFVAGASLAILLLRRPIIDILFGAPFRPSAEPLLILLPGFVVFAVWKILAYGLLGQGYPLFYSLTSALAFAVMIALDLALIPRHGIAGAALASTAAYLISTFVMVIVFVRKSRSSVKDLLLPRKSDWDSVKILFLNARREASRED